MTARRHPNTGQPYTRGDLAWIRENFISATPADIEAELGRSMAAVSQQARRMGLRRKPGGQFPPGNTPWNAGTKGVVGLHPNSRRHHFRPGTSPHNEMPIGSYRVLRGKGPDQLQLKTSDQPGPPHRRWTPVTRLVWEAAHGPVPPGHIVVWRDKRQATTDLAGITADKLECITRAEHAARNHPRSKHPVLAQLAQLRGAITRQVNRINREHQERQNQP